MTSLISPFPLLDNQDVPLVLLGGTLCNARLWQPVIGLLNVSSVQTVTVCAADSAAALSQQLLTVLPPRFYLAGFSLGAIVALEMMAQAPERLAGLALLSVNPLSDAPANAASRRAAVQDAARQGVGPWLSTTLWSRYVAPDRLDDAVLHHTIVQMAQECGTETFARQTEIAITRADHRAALSAFTAPVLVLSGAHDVICTAEHHQAVTCAAPRARWLTLADSGHFLPLESPQAVATALRHWIQESYHEKKSA
ncbi:alpha/beta fold hydrolase [Rahnella woolbedingensis]|nr:alpha/beta hydrolase [Rahnella woolbedingensis]